MDNEKLDKLKDRIIFGTYKLKQKDNLEQLIKYAYSLGIKRIDTAELYRNEETIYDIIKNHNLSDIKITTKISKEKSLIKNRIPQVKQLFGKSLQNILLHHPMDVSYVRTLIQETQDANIQYGVSNYNLQDLIKLISVDKKLIPQVLQIEVHPFKPVIPIITFCQNNNIKVQGHSLLLGGDKALVNNPTLIELSRKYNQTIQTIVIRWAYQLGIDMCLSSSNEKHIDEWLNAAQFELSDGDMSMINGIHTTNIIHLYENIKRPRVLINLPAFGKAYSQQVSLLLQQEYKKFQEGKTLGDVIWHLDVLKNEMYYEPIFKDIINHFCQSVDITQPMWKLILKELRQYKDQQKQKQKSFCLLGSNKDPIKFPEPMHVEVPPEEEFDEIFTYIQQDILGSENLTFKRGTIFNDGRLDLCKQVVGPNIFKKLIQSLQKNQKIKHFLLGNNIAFQYNKQENSQALKELISTKKIQTWYLAGNFIDEECIKIISEGFINNKYAQALWLKRNHIGLGTSYIKNFLNQNNVLQLLDLNNCALNNEGLSALCDNLSNNTLKHLYIDCNNISELKPLQNYIPNSNLETIYISQNPIQQDSLERFFKHTNGNKQIKRICLSSCQLTNNLDFSNMYYPNLISLDLGMYKSTNDLNLKPNLLTDESIPQISELISRHLNLQYIQLNGNKFTNYDWIPYHISTFEKKVHSTEYLQRYVKHPDIVKYIDSVYRGK